MEKILELLNNQVTIGIAAALFSIFGLYEIQHIWNVLRDDHYGHTVILDDTTIKELNLQFEEYKDMLKRESNLLDKDIDSYKVQDWYTAQIRHLVFQEKFKDRSNEYEL